MKLLLLATGLFYSCFTGSMEISSSDQERLKKIKQEMITRSNAKHSSKIWAELPDTILEKSLTIEHVEEFINIYLEQKKTISKETYNDAKAIYNACEKEALHIDASLSRTHSIFYRKKIALKTFENFCLEQRLTTAQTKISHQENDINTLSIGIFCSSGFILLLASLCMWQYVTQKS